MKVDDIEIDIERFIFEIQIRPEIWDLADWHKFGINGIRHKFIKRRCTHSSKQKKIYQDLLADRHKEWQTVSFSLQFVSMVWIQYTYDFASYSLRFCICRQ